MRAPDRRRSPAVNIYLAYVPLLDVLMVILLSYIVSDKSGVNTDHDPQPGSGRVEEVVTVELLESGVLRREGRVLEIDDLRHELAPSSQSLLAIAQPGTTTTQLYRLRQIAQEHGIRFGWQPAVQHSASADETKGR